MLRTMPLVVLFLAKETCVVYPDVSYGLDILLLPPATVCPVSSRRICFPIQLTLLIFAKIFRSIFRDIMTFCP